MFGRLSRRIVRAIAWLVLAAVLAGGAYLVGDLLYQEARESEAEAALVEVQARQVEAETRRVEARVALAEAQTRQVEAETRIEDMGYLRDLARAYEGGETPEYGRVMQFAVYYRAAGAPDMPAAIDRGSDAWRLDARSTHPSPALERLRELAGVDVPPPTRTEAVERPNGTRK